MIKIFKTKYHLKSCKAGKAEGSCITTSPRDIVSCIIQKRDQFGNFSKIQQIDIQALNIGQSKHCLSVKKIKVIILNCVSNVFSFLKRVKCLTSPTSPTCFVYLTCVICLTSPAYLTCPIHFTCYRILHACFACL